MCIKDRDLMKTIISDTHSFSIQYKKKMETETRESNHREEHETKFIINLDASDADTESEQKKDHNLPT